MYEVALMINNLKELEILDKFQNEKDFDGILRDKSIDRIYCGNEFCQYLIPSISELSVVIAECEKRKLNMTLLTPPVTDYGINRLQTIFDYISNIKNLNIEVVFNDWGTLYLLKMKYAHIKAIAGRLLDKMFRDPRLKKQDYGKYFTDKGQKYIMRSSLTSKSYQNLLKKYNVDRVELDLVPQGFSMQKEEIPFGVSLYFPYGYVSMGRLCMMRALGREENKKFLLEDNMCSYKCQDYDQTMSKQIEAYKDDEETEKQWNIKLYRKGNAVFYKNNNTDILEKLDFVDRIIYQAKLPM